MKVPAECDCDGGVQSARRALLSWVGWDYLLELATDVCLHVEVYYPATHPR